MTVFLHYVPVFVSACAAAALGSALGRMVGYRLECVMPRRLGRKSHPGEVPWLGGLGLVLGVVPALMTADVAGRGDILYTAGEMARQRAGIAAGLLVLFFWGVVVDRRRWNAVWVLPGQLAAILITAGAGVRVQALEPLGLSSLSPGWSYVVTVLWLFIVMNFMRFLDGIDGLPEGLAAVIVALHLAQTPAEGWHFMPLLGAALVGALVGALPQAVYPARLYPGQNGSSMPGFMVGVISIVARQKSVLTVTFVLPAAIVFLTLALIGLRVIERQLLLHQRRGR
ncbi:MAG: hypothetical protein Kow0059_20080 [Candidatus Sumerlaeia bacterium]